MLSESSGRNNIVLTEVRTIPFHVLRLSAALFFHFTAFPVVVDKVLLDVLGPYSRVVFRHEFVLSSGIIMLIAFANILDNTIGSKPL